MGYSYARSRWLRKAFVCNQVSNVRQLRQQATASHRAPVSLPTFEQVISVQNLRTSLDLAWDIGAHKAGGPDGVRYWDLSRSDICQIARELHLDLLKGSWGPSVARSAQIPKTNQQFRLLLIRSIATQGIGKTLQRLLSPYWEGIFLPSSYGFRAGRSIADFFIDLERRIVQGNCWIIVQDDIRQAFDNINIDLAMEDHTRHITDARLLKLIRQLLAGHPSEHRQVGTDTGGSYSPVNLNVHLHYRLDAPLNAVAANPGLMRYADNILVPAGTVSEGRETISRAAALLASVGMELKGEDPAVDLRKGETASVLGIQIGAEAGKLRYDLGDKAWGGLRELLAETNEMAFPARSAAQAIQGWIAAYGPALVDARRKELSERILGVAAEYGIAEISPSRVVAAMQSAADRWKQLRAKHGLG